MELTEDLRSWLLEPSDPPLRYRAAIELFGLPEASPEAAALRAELPASKAVASILGKMHPEGYWLQKNPRTGEALGQGVEYGSYATTHFCLSYLAHMGMDKSDARVALAAGRYLDLVKEDGDFYRHISCLLGYNIETFLMLGYRGDERLERAVGLLLASGRGDGGYLCDMHETSGSRRRPKSCVRGSLKALSAFRELGSAYWELPACRQLLDYFLDRGGIFSRKDPSRFASKEAGAIVYPFVWSSGLAEILYDLAVMGRGRDPRLGRAWELLEGKADSEGRYALEWTPTQCPWKVGKRGEPNKWATLYALLAKKAAFSA